MADLDDLNASLNVKIAGASTTGAEQGFISMTTDLASIQRLNVDVAGSAVQMINRADVSASTQTSSSNSGSLESSGFGMHTFYVTVTASSGTTPTMDIYFEGSDDATTWFPVHTTKRFTTTGNDRIQGTRMAGRYYRYRWTIAGTNPSFTFSIYTTLKAATGTRQSFLTYYSDFDLHTISSTSTVFVALSNALVSLQVVRGSDGGNSAQFRVQVSNDASNWANAVGNQTITSANTVVLNLGPAAFRFYRVITTTITSTSNVNPTVIWGAVGA